MSSVVSDVEKSIRSRRLFKRRETILVAVSGGLDSMVLLHVLQQLSREQGWELVVAHFNHGLRGRESEGDERFVRQAAARLGLKCVVGRWAKGKREQIRRHGLEMAARNARYQFLGETATRRKIAALALAHHADDQVELFFIRLLRGAGGEGLAGMKWSTSQRPPYTQVRLVRPLLDQSKESLLAWAKLEGIAFREDSTNRQLEPLRNRIRHELLPVLRDRFEPAVGTTVLRSMEILGADAAWVEETARKWLAGRRRVTFARLHLAMQRQSLRLQLLALAVAPDFDLVERLRQFPEEPVSVNPELAVARDQAGKVRRLSRRPVEFNGEERRLQLKAGGGGGVFGGLKISWEQGAAPPAAPRPAAIPGGEWFDADKVGPVIWLRHWRPGDRFQPIGMAREVKLQDIFTNLKVPGQARREKVVAATAAGQIFWVEGVRISEQFKLDKGTRHRLKWQWRRS